MATRRPPEGPLGLECPDAPWSGKGCRAEKRWGAGKGGGEAVQASLRELR